MRSNSHHSTFPIGAAVSLLVALAIGSMPVAAMLALASGMEALQ